METEEDKEANETAAKTNVKNAEKIKKAQKAQNMGNTTLDGKDFLITCKQFAQTISKWKHSFTKTWLRQDSGIDEEHIAKLEDIEGRDLDNLTKETLQNKYKLNENTAEDIYGKIKTALELLK